MIRWMFPALAIAVFVVGLAAGVPLNTLSTATVAIVGVQFLYLRRFGIAALLIATAIFSFAMNAYGADCVAEVIRNG